MKPHTIRLFMWGYQIHFHISVRLGAEELFRKLNPELEVETFLLGLIREETPGHHPICLEPEDCGFQISDFDGIREDAGHRRAIDPESSVICWDEGHHQAFHARVESRAYREAVLARLNGWQKKKAGEYFFSGFMPVGKYDVGVVLRLHYKDGDKPYMLPKVHAELRYGPRKSLVEAAVEEFFLECRKALNKPNPECVDDLNGRPVDELLRCAGDRFMETPGWATRNIGGIYGLFNACNVISSLPYEGAQSIGRMLLGRQNHPNIEETLSLSKPVYLSRYRAVRKLLQIAASGDALLCDGAKITGFGHVRGNYDQAEADVFEIQFTSHYTWELAHSGHRLMRVAYGNPKLPLFALNKKKLENDLHRIFKQLNNAQCEALVDLALAACEQKHGALLVISGAAEQEAERLSRQSTQITPVKLSPEMITRVTAIDGAVLLNPLGICFAIGVILDGLATPEGDPGRGARYNSSLRYISGKEQCLAVIVSEDGTAEWVPNLRPQLQRKELEWAQTEVQQITEQKTLDENRAGKVLKWLHDHRFYLSQILCEGGNELQNRYDAMLREQGAIVVQHPPLKSDPQMNGEYLLD